MKTEKIKIGFSYEEKMSCGIMKHEIIRITKKCIFCKCFKNGIEAKEETRFEKDYFLSRFN